MLKRLLTVAVMLTLSSFLVMLQNCKSQDATKSPARKGKGSTDSGSETIPDNWDGSTDWSGNPFQLKDNQ